MSDTSPGGPLRQVLLDGAIDDETLGQHVDCSGRPYIVIYLKGTGTTSGGAITIEEADWGPDQQDYTGTWAIVGSAVNASDVSGGKQKAVHLTVGSYKWVRVRVSDAITGGGSVAAVLVAC